MARIQITARTDHLRSVLRVLGASITLNSGSTGSCFLVDGDVLTIEGPQITVERRSVEFAVGTRISNAQWDEIVETGVQAGSVQRTDRGFVVR
jgi:hypothetical protein